MNDRLGNLMGTDGMEHATLARKRPAKKLVRKPGGKSTPAKHPARMNTEQVAATLGVTPRRVLAIAKQRGVEPIERYGTACVWAGTQVKLLTPGQPAEHRSGCTCHVCLGQKRKARRKARSKS